MENTNRRIVRIDRIAEDEEFRLIPTTSRYYVSNYGRALKLILDVPTDTLLERPIKIMKNRNKTNRIYSSIRITTTSGETINCRLSRALCKTFKDSSLGLLFKDDKRVIDHIDNNSENNHIDNLRIVSYSENIRAAMDMGIIVGHKPVECVAYNVKTGEVRNYKTTKELCNDIFDSNNGGFFNRAYNFKTVNKKGWRVAYTLDEIIGGNN